MEKDSVDISDASFVKIYCKQHGAQAAVAGCQKVVAILLQLTSPILLQKVIDQVTLFDNDDVHPIQKVKELDIQLPSYCPCFKF